MRAPPPDPRAVEARALGAEVWHELLGGIDLLDDRDRQTRRYALAIMIDEFWRAVVFGTHNGPLIEAIAKIVGSIKF